MVGLEFAWEGSTFLWVYVRQKIKIKIFNLNSFVESAFLRINT